MIRVDETGQELLFYTPKSKTFHCFACGRDILNRARYTHPSTRHRQRVVKSRKRGYARPSWTVPTDDERIEEFYRQCAIEDGTYAAIAEEYGL